MFYERSYEKRGSYNHNRLGKQLLRFDGLEYGTITPMDVDCAIEYRDAKIVLIEVKMKNVQVPIGERLALQRFVDDFTRAGKQAIAIVADHTVFDPNDDIQIVDCLVRELYLGTERRWRPPKKMMTVKTLTDSFLEMQ